MAKAPSGASRQNWACPRSHDGPLRQAAGAHLVSLRILALAVLLVGLLAWRAPAQLLDSGLDALSGGQLRLLSTQGTLWRGNGVLTARDAAGTSTPLLPLSWNTRLLPAEGGIASLVVSEGTTPVARLSLEAGGLRIRADRLALPLRPLLGGASQPALRLGWDGHLEAGALAVRCGWRGGCEGSATLHARRLAVDIVRGLTLGDYEIAMRGTDAHGTFAIRSLGGAVTVDGQGEWKSANVHFAGDMTGPPELVSRLPNIAGPHAIAGAEPGRVALRYPATTP